MKKIFGLLAVSAITLAIICSCKQGPEPLKDSSGNYDYGTAKVGDIVLKDGSLCSLNEYDKYTGATAIIFREQNGTQPALGVGLVRGSGVWDSTSTNDNSIQALTNLQSGLNSLDLLMEAKGDFTKADLKDNTKYSAWDYCYNYGRNNNLSKLEKGWYLPSVSELKSLYECLNGNIGMVFTEKLAVDFSKSNGRLGSSYWSCEQDSENALGAVMYSMSRNEIVNYSFTTTSKNCESNVIAIREFKNNIATAKVGDVIMKSGLVLSSDSIDDSNKSEVMAVIVRNETDSQSALGIGVEMNGEMEWCSSDCKASGIRIKNLEGLSTGWDSIIKLAQDENMNGDFFINSEKYPAWNFCYKYGKDFSRFSDGWYLPQTTELIEAFGNENVKNTLKKLGIDITNRTYWTCVQRGSNAENAIYVDERTNNFSNTTKTTKKYVAAMRVFSDGEELNKPVITISSNNYSGEEIKISTPNPDSEIYYFLHDKTNNNENSYFKKYEGIAPLNTGRYYVTAFALNNGIISVSNRTEYEYLIN